MGQNCTKMRTEREETDDALVDTINGVAILALRNTEVDDSILFLDADAVRILHSHFFESSTDTSRRQD